MTATSVRELAREIVALRRRVNGLSGSQLGHSSLEGRPLRAYDEEGQLSAIIGRQFDGTHAVAVVSGPKPPKPAPLTVQPILDGAVLTWGGDWEGGETVVVPSDFLRAEIHVSTDAQVPSTGAPTTTIETPRGGSVFVKVAPETFNYARVVVRTTSGKLSDPSESVGPFEGLALTSFAGNTIHFGPTTPEPTKVSIGDLWLKVLDEGPPAQHETRRWDGADWELVVDQGISDALIAAEAASAAAALGARLFTQPEAPEWTGGANTALWQDTNNGNLTHIWTGTGWGPRLITGSSIQPNSLVAEDVIATGTVTAALLEAILVLATQIVAGDPAAARCVFDTAGIRAYNALGEETFRVDSATGGVTMSGTLISRIGDDSLTISGALWENRPGIVFRKQGVSYTNPDTGQTNLINQSVVSTGSANNPSHLGLFSGHDTAGRSSSALFLQPQRWAMHYYRKGPVATQPATQGFLSANVIDMRSERELTATPADLFPEKPIQIKTDRTNLNGAIRNQWGLTGGGRKRVTSVGISWTDTFVIINQGVSNYVVPVMPPDGSVIRGWGGKADVTVTGGMIPMSKGDTLYYMTEYENLPAAQRFAITGGGGTPYVMPFEAVMICHRSWFLTGVPAYRWGTGEVDDHWRDLLFLNGWDNYGGNFLPCQYKKIGTQIRLRGLLRAGITTHLTIVAYIPDPLYGPPSGFASIQHPRCGTTVSSGRIDIANGNNDTQTWLRLVDTPLATGDYVSLDGLAWDNA